jgi:prepilin-type N-terminal cleavage/methylation domain-containing protein
MISNRAVWRRRATASRGVTLIELVIAMALLAVSLAGIYGFMATGATSARVTNDFLQVQAQVRAAVDSVVDEARWAQTVTCASGTAVTLLVPQDTPFSAASPYRVTFEYDAANDTLTRREDAAGVDCPPARAGEPIAYSVVRAGGHDGAAFEYFSGAGASLGSAPADLNAIARLRITVTTMRDTVTRTFAGDAALRGREPQ